MTEAGSTDLSAGAISVLAPDTWHGYLPEPRIDVANVYISREILNRELYWLAGLPRVGPLLSVNGDEHREASLTFRLNSAALQAVRGPLDRLGQLGSSFLFQISSLLDLLAIVEPAFRHEAVEVRAVPFFEAGGNAAARYRPTVARAIALFHEQLDHQWGLPELAQEVALSPSQLVRVFKADTGLPPLSYLQRLRVERLAYLMRTTDLTISSAARQVGWYDGSFAARRFREAWGAAPGEYRRRFNWTAQA